MDPPHLRKLPLQVGDLRREGWGGHGAGHHPQAASAGRQQDLPTRVERGDEIGPALQLPAAGDRLRAPRIVKRQNTRLHDGAGRAEAGRMDRVALDLDRAPGQVLEQDALGIAGIGERRRVMARDRRHQLRRLLDIGHELAGVGFGSAAGQRRHDHRGRHDLQEAAPVEMVETLAEARHLALDERREIRAVGERFEPAPEIPGRAAHRCPLIDDRSRNR